MNRPVKVWGDEEGETRYTYDLLGRVLTETDSINGASTQTSYAYDSYGNRVSKAVSGAETSTTSYVYDNNNRLTKETINDNISITENSYDYDNNGNMVCRLTGRYAEGTDTVSAEESLYVLGNSIENATDTNNSEVVYYTYNKFNQLTNVQSDDGLNARYTYSPDGRRLYKTINGETIYTHNDGSNVIAEVKPDGSITKYYRGASLIASSNGDTISRYSYDPHGSVTMINGADAYTYDAFGNQLTSANADNPFRYCGEYYDTETGFIYLRNRYYNPSTGRFISEDPIKDGLNWYVYCGNNPVMFVDPLGLTPSVMEAAQMAEHIYDYNEKSSKDERTVAGWRLITVYEGRQGMKMGVYIPDGDNWENPSEYVIAYKGTTWYDLQDWQNNIEQLFSSKSADMWDAINCGRAFVENHWDESITFVGHSKGGAEAASAAVSTNRDAIIFNPATSNLSDYGLNSDNYIGNMTAYIVEGDIVNYLEGSFSTPIDEVKYLRQQYGGHWYEGWKTDTVDRILNHLMPAVKNALVEEGY